MTSMVTALTVPVLRPLTIPCGMDWTIAVPFTDGVTGAPIDVATPKCQVRAGQYDTAALLLTPTCSVDGNTVTVLFPGAATGQVGVPRGFYDLFVTRVDSGAPVKLIYGPVTFVANTTDLG